MQRVGRGGILQAAYWQRRDGCPTRNRKKQSQHEPEIALQKTKTRPKKNSNKRWQLFKPLYYPSTAMAPPPPPPPTHPPQTPSLLEPFCVHKSGRPCACKTWTSNCRKANDGIKGLFQFIREVDLPVASKTESGSHSVTRHGNPAKTKANEEREHGQMQRGEQQQKNVL